MLYPNNNVSKDKSHCAQSKESLYPTFHVSDSCVQVCPETLDILGCNQRFHIQKAVAVGNIYRLLLGGRQPNYYAYFDNHTGKYYRLSEFIPSLIPWSEVIDTPEEKFIDPILGSPPQKQFTLNLTNGRLIKNGKEYLLKNFLNVGFAAVLLGDLDVNPSNIQCVIHESTLNVIKVDPECGFSYQFFERTPDQLIEALTKFTEIGIGYDYFSSTTDEFEEFDEIVNQLFAPEKIEKARRAILNKFSSISMSTYTQVIDSAISDEFETQKQQILSQLQQVHNTISRYLAWQEYHSQALFWAKSSCDTREENNTILQRMNSVTFASTE